MMDKNVRTAQQKWANIKRKTEAVVALIENGTFSSNDLVRLGTLIGKQSQLASYLFEKQTRAMQIQAQAYIPELETQLRNVGIDVTDNNVSYLVDKVFARILQKSLPDLTSKLEKISLAEGTKFKEFADKLMEERKLFTEQVEESKKANAEILQNISSAIRDLPKEIASKLEKQAVPDAVASIKTENPVAQPKSLITESDGFEQNPESNDTTPQVVENVTNVYNNPTSYYDNTYVTQAEQQAPKLDNGVMNAPIDEIIRKISEKRNETPKKLPSAYDKIKNEFIIFKSYIEQKINDTRDYIRSGIATQFEAFKENGRLMYESLKERIPAIQFIEDIVVGIKKGVTKIVKKSKERWDVLRDKVGSITDKVRDFLGVDDIGSLLSLITSVAFFAPLVAKIIANIDWNSIFERGFNWIIKNFLPKENGNPPTDNSKEPPKIEGKDAKGRKTSIVQDEDGVYHNASINPDGTVDQWQSWYNPLQIEGEGRWKDMVKLPDKDLRDVGIEAEGTYRRYYDPKTGKIYGYNDFDAGFESEPKDVTDDNKELVQELNKKYNKKQYDARKQKDTYKKLSESTKDKINDNPYKLYGTPGIQKQESEPPLGGIVPQKKAQAAVTKIPEPSKPIRPVAVPKDNAKSTQKPQVKQIGGRTINPEPINIGTTRPLGAKSDETLGVINGKEL